MTYKQWLWFWLCVWNKSQNSLSRFMQPANFAFQKLKQFQLLFLFTSFYSVSLKSQTFMDFCLTDTVNSQFFLAARSANQKEKLSRESTLRNSLCIIILFFNRFNEKDITLSSIKKIKKYLVWFWHRFKCSCDLLKFKL